jgi:ribosome-associated translation inhibitor RaiA
MVNETIAEISHANFPEKLEIQEEVQKFLNKFQVMWKISKFKLHIDTYSAKGRKKYSMHAKVIASDILFNAKASSWNIPSTLDILFERLSKMIGKELKKLHQR